MPVPEGPAQGAVPPGALWPWLGGGAGEGPPWEQGALAGPPSLQGCGVEAQSGAWSELPCRGLPAPPANVPPPPAPWPGFCPVGLQGLAGRALQRLGLTQPVRMVIRLVVLSCPVRGQDPARRQGHLERAPRTCRRGSLASAARPGHSCRSTHSGLPQRGVATARSVCGGHGCPGVSGFHRKGLALHTCLLNAWGAGDPVVSAAAQGPWAARVSAAACSGQLPCAGSPGSEAHPVPLRT